MRLAFSASCKQAKPLVNFPVGLNMDPFTGRRRKDKVVVVMGATGTGKSRLSIDLATRFGAEIVNCDKMQVYKGLDIVTNKVTEEECQGVPHHLLGFVDPNWDFTATDFRHHASLALESIRRQDRLPIITGGSNSFIKALVNDDIEFQSRYKCCFLWVDVSMPVLHSFVSERVDQMVVGGLVNEVKRLFDPEADYALGIRRAIGVPEMDEFLRAELTTKDVELRARLLELAIDQIKNNTCKLACKQLQNILRLQSKLGWKIHHLDATEAFLKHGDQAHETWDKFVAGPSARIVGQFLYEDDIMAAIGIPTSTSVITSASVMGAATSTAIAAVSR